MLATIPRAGGAGLSGLLWEARLDCVTTAVWGHTTPLLGNLKVASWQGTGAPGVPWGWDGEYSSKATQEWEALMPPSCGQLHPRLPQPARTAAKWVQAQVFLFCKTIVILFMSCTLLPLSLELLQT